MTYLTEDQVRKFLMSYDVICKFSNDSINLGRFILLGNYYVLDMYNYLTKMNNLNSSYILFDNVNGINPYINDGGYSYHGQSSAYGYRGGYALYFTGAINSSSFNINYRYYLVDFQGNIYSRSTSQTVPGRMLMGRLCYVNDKVYLEMADIIGITWEACSVLHSGIYSLTNNFTITVTESSYGTCTVSKTEAEEGDTITVTCTPNAGYKLYDVFVVGDTVGRITTEKTSLNVQTFTMPADNVKVSAVFVSIDPYKPGGDTQPQDRGEGTFDNTSDEIITPDELTLNYSDSGLVRLFNPDSAKLKDFGDFLWGNLIDYDTIKKAFSNPMDQIISLHTIPIGLSTTTEEEVVFGGIGSGVSMRPVTKQFYKVNMGTLHIPRFYATALDYSPFTRLQLYLPFIGEKDIDADEVMGKDLSVSYQIDALSGAAVAYVSISGQLVYMFSGNVAQYIPVSQSNFSGIINGVTGIAGAIASVAGGILTLTGNPAIGAAMSAVGGTKSERNEARAMQMRHAQTMNTLGGVEQIGQGAGNLVNALTGKPNTAHIGLAQGVAGYMSYPTPYVLIKRPHQSLATNFYSQYGYPANLSLNLAELSGFCKLASIDITSFPGTASELAELKHILQSGFYIRGNTAPTYTTTSGLTIAFEHSNSETNACGKSLTTVAALTGELRQESDLLNPVIDIQGNIESYLTANEVCIPTFNRRYFITEWTAARKNLFRIHLHCDVLQSFWDSIKSAPCIVERYENQWTLDLNDPYFQVSQDLLMQQLKFTSSFQLSNSSFVLAIAGNGATII